MVDIDIAKDIVSKIWPAWTVTESLGKGAFAPVFKAVRQDLSGTSYAAIKIIRIPKDNEETEKLRKRRFKDSEIANHYLDEIREYTAEIRLMDSVKGYTNIVTIEDHMVYKPEDEMAWYILIRMELLTPLDRKKPCNEKDIIQLGIDICNALDICSKYNIVHRDIKPQNIFVNNTGDYKLGDFGVARNLEMTVSALSISGTWAYMAPEMLALTAKNVNFQAVMKMDLYSLGMVLYEYSNNSKLPFMSSDFSIATIGEKEKAYERRIRGEELPPPNNVSSELQSIIQKACAYKPEDRYESAKEMLNDLQKLQAKKTVSTTHPKEKKARTILLLIDLLLLAAMIGYVSIKGGPSEIKPVPTEPVQKHTQGGTTYPPQDPIQDPIQEPTQEPNQEPNQEPTQAPTQEPTFTPAATPVPAPLPVSVYATMKDKLATRTGPSTDYTECGTFDLTGQKVGVISIAKDNKGTDWVLVEAYESGKPLLRAYTGLTRLNLTDSQLSQIPKEAESVFIGGGKVKEDIIPKRGPGNTYINFDNKFTIKQGTYVNIIRFEGDYCLVEYPHTSGKTHRCWIPSDYILTE